METLQQKLARLIAASTKSESANSDVIINTALLIVNKAEEQLAYEIKPYFGKLRVQVIVQSIELISHVELLAQKYKAKYVATTQQSILAALVRQTTTIKLDPNVSDYAGSLFKYNNIEVLILNPLMQIHSVIYGDWLCRKYLTKFNVDAWHSTTPFSFTVVNPENYEESTKKFARAIAIAVDIETVKDNLRITCVGFSAIIPTATGHLETKTIVIPLTSEYNYTAIKNILNLPPAKITQGGDYDICYLLRYNLIPRNWMWDTMVIQHCWYSELPKDLGSLGTLFIRDIVYWKDLANTSDLYEYYKYNALDCWATANIWITQMLNMPEYARHNYTLEFPLMFPCVLSSMTGVQRDEEKLRLKRKELDVEAARLQTTLDTMVGISGFKANSPKKVKILLTLLGCGDLPSTEAVYLNQAALRHPINNEIIDCILSIRGIKKLSSTYLRMQEDEEGSKDYLGTFLYKLKPYGTDTGRLSSAEHPFWIGSNIQNIPRGKDVKQTLSAPKGFFIGECDLEQAETRDTAYIIGEDKLINAVEGDKDFHSLNCSAFFGVPYDAIYSDNKRKVLDKSLRDISKRVNHGANYNMGAGTLVLTMGLKKIYEAKKLLKLTISDPKEIASHLLAGFHRTYEKISKLYYPWIVRTILNENRLTSRAFHHTEYNLRLYKTIEEQHKQINTKGDWTRYCFGRPDKNKLILNSYIAHCPQSLNARTLNEAYIRVFYEVALKYPESFRLHAQIHDSILFSYADNEIGRSHPEIVKRLMEIPITIKTLDNRFLEFVVPAGMKLGTTDSEGNINRATYWSDIE